MKNLNIELYRQQNYATLANLRRRQIEEENNPLPISDSAIEKQIDDWLSSGHQAFFLKWDADIRKKA